VVVSRPLRVLVNATASRIGGGLSYTLAQLGHLERIDDLRLEVFASPWNVDALRASLCSPVHLVRVPGVAARFAWEQMVLPVRLRDHDVLYCPNNFLPLGPYRVPAVLTLQDANYWVGREQLRRLHDRAKMVKRTLALASARRADRLVVISNSLRDAVLATRPRLAHKTVVVHSGAPSWPDGEVPVPALADRADRRPVEDVADWVLVLANDYPHKRLDLVVSAWAEACASARSPALVICGLIRPDRERSLAALVPAVHRDRFVHLGAIGDRRQLKWLLRRARALVSVSVLEAHPLTPAEAGSLGCPLILSDIPAHREVAGDHARYVPPDDRSALVAALASISARATPRTPWQWPVSWSDHARAMAEVLVGAARRPGRLRTRQVRSADR
jgi:glycosyltransferase involved in cell wall biosynthesis